MALHWSLGKQANIYFNHKNYLLILYCDIATKENGIRSSSKVLQSSSDQRKERTTPIPAQNPFPLAFFVWRGQKGRSECFPCVEYSGIYSGSHFKCHIVRLPYGRVGPVAWSSPMGPVVSPGQHSIHLPSLYPMGTKNLAHFLPSGYNHLPFHLGSLPFRPSLTQLTNFSFSFLLLERSLKSLKCFLLILTVKTKAQLGVSQCLFSFQLREII